MRYHAYLALFIDGHIFPIYSELLYDTHVSVLLLASVSIG